MRTCPIVCVGGGGGISGLSEPCRPLNGGINPIDNDRVKPKMGTGGGACEVKSKTKDFIHRVVCTHTCTMFSMSDVSLCFALIGAFLQCHAVVFIQLLFLVYLYTGISLVPQLAIK